MTTRQRLDDLASRRILVLDGAMGSMVQRFGLTEAEFRGEAFKDHPRSLKGCNDLLCLTRPGVVAALHQAYLRAGADIIETCTFNATAVSLAEYGLADQAYAINEAAARIARESADRYSTPEKPRFVAGSIGPTGKAASLSPSVDDPGARSIRWDELVAAYRSAARGLLDGGVDILLVETVVDTLNGKAALYAVAQENDRGVPLMVSGSIVDASGRTLSGQTVEAFYASVAHAGAWSVGLNCSLGAAALRPNVAALSAVAGEWVSAHPNAGLPNRFGQYDESPDATAAQIEAFLSDGLVNIVGGCCGTTPAHIAAISLAAAKYQPRRRPVRPAKAVLSGLEPLDLALGFVDIGERTNVAGSKKFLRLVKDGQFDAALAIARDMVAAGAGIIDVCMDDALLDAGAAMVRFLELAMAEPEIARVPVMVDSSRWEVIEAGLKCLQGRSVVNSISLKEGPAKFRERALAARSYGAAVVVMLFDEAGQADSYERKIAVAGRAWKELLEAGLAPTDVIFDPNVLAVATGLPEHDSYALDFIRACAWITANCPGAGISGGVSNLSFSFRGQDSVREALHSVFLRHAVAAGLSMAIVNPAGLVSYEDLDPELRDLAEDVVLARRADAAERLLRWAEGHKADAQAPGAAVAAEAWRSWPADERIAHALVKGIDDFIAGDVLEVRPRFAKTVDLIEGPLMRGMNLVGERFGAGQMFLPQVIRSARVMKRAVAALEPFLQAEKAAALAAGDAAAARRPKVVLATVKGDVHDIGKNIVGVVLACNGFDVVDLGVMVPAETILAANETERADQVGLSGLITPSLDEMAGFARELEARGLTLPLLIGGATTSEAHTALRIAPGYSGPAVYVKDASRASAIARSLLSATERPRFLEKLDADYRAAAARHERIAARTDHLALDAARANKPRLDWTKAQATPPRRTGLIELGDYPLEALVPFIDWSYFFYAWDLGHGFASVLDDPIKGEAARKLYADAQALLADIVAAKRLRASGVVGFFPAAAEGDDLVVYAEPAVPAAARREIGRFSFPRNQERKLAGGANPCLADFVAPAASGLDDWVGLFAVGAGFGLEELAAEYTAKGDDYSALLAKTLADRLAEAMAEAVHERVRKEFWGYAPDEKLGTAELFAGRYRGIRPAFGYPACPDHADKRLAFRLLEAETRCGFALTETAMMKPAASVCGLYFAHPAAYYFGCGSLQADQLADWAARKGIGVNEAAARSGRI
jgi:5-methyltetrahydrofolate--homocysteine methyltransferase